MTPWTDAYQNRSYDQIYRYCSCACWKRDQRYFFKPLMSEHQIQLFGSFSTPSASTSRRRLTTVQDHQISSAGIPTHLIQPLGFMDDLAFNRSCGEYIRSRRILISQGWPAEMVLGPEEVDLDAVFGDNSIGTQVTTVSQWVASIVLPYDDLGVPERLGLMLLIGRLVRVSSMTWLYAQLVELSNG